MLRPNSSVTFKDKKKDGDVTKTVKGGIRRFPTFQISVRGTIRGAFLRPDGRDLGPILVLKNQAEHRDCHV
jgi:hypothetical protein